MFQRLDKPNYHKLNTWNDLTKKIVKFNKTIYLLL